MNNKQNNLITWAKDTFGPIAIDKEERVKRFAEEAIELCQSCGLDKYYLLHQVCHVYDKEIGNIAQEIGQAGLCLSMLAEVYMIDADKEADNEFIRVRSFDKEYWQERQNKKYDNGLGGKCDD